VHAREAGAVLTLPAIDAHLQDWDPARCPCVSPATELTPGRTLGPDDLRLELETEGMTGALVVQVSTDTGDTADLLAQADSLPFVLGVVGWVDLTRPDLADVMDELRAAPGGQRLVGLGHRVHDEEDPDWLANAGVRRGLATLAAKGLVFDVAVRARELPATLAAAKALPDLCFVLRHLARPPIASGDLAAWGRALLPLSDLPNVVAKVSGLVTEADWHTWSIDDLRHPLELALDAFGCGRLMLGSDWPRCLLAGSYGDAIESVRYLVAELSSHEQAEIGGLTAARVYRLAPVRAWPS
jgi:L-fuconolactonase